MPFTRQPTAAPRHAAPHRRPGLEGSGGGSWGAGGGSGVRPGSLAPGRRAEPPTVTPRGLAWPPGLGAGGWGPGAGGWGPGVQPEPFSLHPCCSESARLVITAAKCRAPVPIAPLLSRAGPVCGVMGEWPRARLSRMRVGLCEAILSVSAPLSLIRSLVPPWVTRPLSVLVSHLLDGRPPAAPGSCRAPGGARWAWRGGRRVGPRRPSTPRTLLLLSPLSAAAWGLGAV